MDRGILSVFRGGAVNALAEVHAPNPPFFTSWDWFYVAAIAPVEVAGEIDFSIGASVSIAGVPIPGNLLQAPSWEGDVFLKGRVGNFRSLGCGPRPSR